jgi:hypothetical protein
VIAILYGTVLAYWPGGTHVLAGWYRTHVLAGFSLLARVDLDGEVGEDLLASAVEHVHAERSRE